MPITLKVTDGIKTTRVGLRELAKCAADLPFGTSPAAVGAGRHDCTWAVRPHRCLPGRAPILPSRAPICGSHL